MMAKGSGAGTRPLRPRLLHYVVLEALQTWSDHLASRHLDDDVRRNNPAFVPSIVGLPAIELIRMGYPLRMRLEFQDPGSSPGFDIARSRDLSDVLQLFQDEGLILTPDSYFPNYQLTWEGVTRLEGMRRLADSTYQFLRYEASPSYFSAALGLDYTRPLRVAPIIDIVQHWVEVVANSDLLRIRQLWIDAAVQLYREGDWVGDFTFDNVYARMMASPFAYRAAIKSGTQS